MRSLVVLFVIVLLCSVAVIDTSTVSAHGCAPSTPPALPGSPAPLPATQGVILLNEVLLNPQSHWNCSQPGTTFTDRDAWVELYNPQNQSFDLHTPHAYIDSGPNTNRYYLPSGAAIAGHGFLVVFPRTYGPFVQTETSTLRLGIAGMIIDWVKVPTLMGDQSYARVVDGASKWQVTDTPTIDASNNASQLTPTPSSSSGNPGRGAFPTTNTGGPLVNGTQPAWSRLQLPTPTPTSPAPVSITSMTQPASPSGNDGMTLPQRITLTLLAVALALTLLWCWRLFKTS